MSNLTNTQSDCPLFRLPAELRNRVYEEVFAVPKTKYGSTIIRRIPYSHHQRHSVLALLKTCRLIDQEAETIFFDLNSIEIEERYWWSQGSSYNVPFENHRRWKQALSAEKFAMVHNITMQIYSPYQANEMLAFLERMPGIQTITFVMENRVASCFLSSEDQGIGPRMRQGQQEKANGRFWTKVETLKHERGWSLRAVIHPADDKTLSVDAFNGRLSAL